MRYKYQCSECDHVFNGHPIKIDGTCCPLCNGYAGSIGPADPALDEKSKVSKLTVTVDVCNTDLFKKVLGILQHITETTTCEATKAYIVEQVGLITDEHEESK